MLNRVCADAVLLGHFVFVAFAVLGGALAYWSPLWAWGHVPVVLWNRDVDG